MASSQRRWQTHRDVHQGWLAVVLALALHGCSGDDADDDPGTTPAPDRDAGRAPAPTDGGSQRDESGYGDGVCTTQEFAEGNEAIDIVADLSRAGLGLAQGYLADHAEMLDGIWADCTEEFCPVVHQAYLDCASKYVDLDAGADDDEDAGPPPSNPCFPAPAECDAFL